jgi:voltage-gated potassium channel
MTEHRKMDEIKRKPRQDSWRARTHEIIFEADTPAGKTFDMALIVCIIVSVIAVMLDSISGIQRVHGGLLYKMEWFFTVLFTVEYIVRLISVGRPWKYATSFFGIVDLLAVVPTYLSLIIPGSQYLLVIRILRVLRIFRVLKIVQYVSEANLLLHALRASRRKITVFLFTVLTLVIIFGPAERSSSAVYFVAFSILAQVSRRPTARLKTRAAAVDVVSAQK